MFDYTILNLISLVFGLLAWLFPLLDFYSEKKEKKFLFIFFSFTACLISILSQMGYQYYEVVIEDFTALMDTSGFVLVASLTLTLSTIIMNGVNLYKITKKNKA